MSCQQILIRQLIEDMGLALVVKTYNCHTGTAQLGLVIDVALKSFREVLSNRIAGLPLCC